MTGGATAADGSTAQAARSAPRQASLSQLRPCLNWDLTLQPAALNSAYWYERAPKLSKWDYQVNLFLMLMMFTMVFKFAHEGMVWYLLSFGAAWVMCLSWLMAMHHPTLYTRHRVHIVTLVRILMGVTAMYATGGVRDQLYKTLMFPSAVLTVGFKMFLFCNTGQIPVEAVRLQLPIATQVGVTGLKAFCLFLGEFTPAFVAFCNTPRYLAALTTSTRFWCNLVQSGAPLQVPPSGRLVGRSSIAVEALLILYVTDVALVSYMCYMSLWNDVRMWLAGKAAEAAEPQPDAPPGVVIIAGLAVSTEQLQEMRNTPAAALLLGPTGWLGRASQLCLHACAVSMMCLTSLLLAQLLAQQLLPELLSEPRFNEFYPLLPMQTESMCSPGTYC